MDGEYGHSFIRLENKKITDWEAYNLKFRFPSEHKIDGKQYDLELQIYHKNKNNQMMVISIMVSGEPADMSRIKSDKDDPITVE